MGFNLMILAADPDSAVKAQSAGIDRIFYDLEYINKMERQHGRNTVISHNNIDDIPAVRNVLITSKLLVRTNPIHAYSRVEIDKVISYGADILMLPMVLDQHDAEAYVEMVAGRAKVCIMIETAQALARIDKILAVPGVDEIFIGLNDLHISMGLTFMFELLSDGLVEYVANKCNAANMPFGFGGIARIGEGMLPCDYILGEHVRLCSQSVILSRSFKGDVGGALKKIRLDIEVNKVRARLQEIHSWTEAQFIENTSKVVEGVDLVINKICGKI
ncbi:aldolase [Parabacteroides sp. AF18-52]|jgi:hypothetical protein|uniref:aldolase/citrate lyase family protein n=1 Tax=Parabacteroides TaxID=375288 RepID=UPI000EFE506D|nr:aldolase/citrate lyase family protein [Parabacteroides sp. AF18-52]RHR43393.1 aldolase [Parabacteroides sp. AF18-52]